jgi:hypothetical protein
MVLCCENTAEAQSIPVPVGRLSSGVALLGREAVDLAFDREQDVDALHGSIAIGRLVQPRHEIPCSVWKIPCYGEKIPC